MARATSWRAELVGWVERSRETQRICRGRLGLAALDPTYDSATPDLFPLVGIDHIARLVLGRIENHLGGEVTERVDAAVLDVLELDQQHAFLGPLPLGAELHVADHGLEGGLAEVVGELLVVEALDRRNRVAEHLQVGVGPHRHVVAERIDAFGRGPRLIFLQELHRARKLHGRRRNPGLVVDDAVEQRAELGLERGRLQADHGAADHLRLEADLVDRPHHADRVERIGADDGEIRIGRLHGAHDGAEIGLRRRIVAVVDDFQPGRLGVLVRAVGSVARELGIGPDDRHRLRLGVLGHRYVEEALGERRLRVGPGRNHDEIFRIVELLVHRETEHADEQPVLLHHHRHRRRQHVGGIAADDEIDVIDVEQLGVDRRHFRWAALVVVIDELDRAAEQRALAVGRERAGERHAEADPQRLGGLAWQGAKREREGAEHRRAEPGEGAFSQMLQHWPFLPRSRLFSKAFMPQSAGRRQGPELTRPSSRPSDPARDAGEREPGSMTKGLQKESCPWVPALAPPRSAGMTVSGVQASTPSTMTFSTSPAPLRRNAAAWPYSGEVKQATACSKVGNSITMKRWNLSGPSMMRNLPPRASTLPPWRATMPGTRSVYFLYSTGSMILDRATQ